ncbi:MAG: 3-hydroxyacyl-CoA dehydrogenase [Gaiella sp.]
MTEPVAVVGASLVGRSWAIVFARAGHPVRLWDSSAAVLEEALDSIAGGLHELAELGLLGEETAAVRARVAAAGSLGDAAESAGYVQECTSESLDSKRAVFEQLDEAAPQECVLASSSSTLRTSLFASTLPGRGRCLVAHPINPPHLAPIVELSPAPFTEQWAVERARELHEQAGMSPILVRREIDGFVLNRLQAALLAEAWQLVADGYVSVDDVDRTVRDGLGLRWSFMGPFETIDLNAPGGLGDYARLYGRNLQALVRDRRYGELEDALIDTVEAERRAIIPRDELAARQAWRNRRLARLAAHRKTVETEEGTSRER